MTREAHLGVVEELKKTSVVGGCPLEDGKENLQDILLALWILDSGGFRSRQAAAVEHREAEFDLGVSESECYGELS